MFNTEVYSQDVDRAIVYLGKLAERVARRKAEKASGSEVDKHVMYEADEVYGRMNGQAERLAAALEKVAKARIEAEMASGDPWFVPGSTSASRSAGNSLN